MGLAATSVSLCHGVCSPPHAGRPAVSGTTSELFLRAAPGGTPPRPRKTQATDHGIRPSHGSGEDGAGHGETRSAPTKQDWEPAGVEAEPGEGSRGSDRGGGSAGGKAQMDAAAKGPTSSGARVGWNALLDAPSTEADMGVVSHSPGRRAAPAAFTGADAIKRSCSDGLGRALPAVGEEGAAEAPCNVAEEREPSSKGFGTPQGTAEGGGMEECPDSTDHEFMRVQLLLMERRRAAATIRDSCGAPAASCESVGIESSGPLDGGTDTEAGIDAGRGAVSMDGVAGVGQPGGACEGHGERWARSGGHGAVENPTRGAQSLGTGLVREETPVGGRDRTPAWEGRPDSEALPAGGRTELDPSGGGCVHLAPHLPGSETPGTPQLFRALPLGAFLGGASGGGAGAAREERALSEALMRYEDEVAVASDSLQREKTPGRQGNANGQQTEVAVAQGHRNGSHPVTEQLTGSHAAQTAGQDASGTWTESALRDAAKAMRQGRLTALLGDDSVSADHGVDGTGGASGRAEAWEGQPATTGRGLDGDARSPSDAKRTSRGPGASAVQGGESRSHDIIGSKPAPGLPRDGKLMHAPAGSGIREPTGKATAAVPLPASKSSDVTSARDAGVRVSRNGGGGSRDGGGEEATGAEASTGPELRGGGELGGPTRVSDGAEEAVSVAEQARGQDSTSVAAFKAKLRGDRQVSPDGTAPLAGSAAVPEEDAADGRRVVGPACGTPNESLGLLSGAGRGELSAEDAAEAGAIPTPEEAAVAARPDLLRLETYLPQGLCQALQRGRSDMQLYPWQAAAVLRVLETGQSLVYCAPTSGGKSLVAEILMLRRIAVTGRPAVLVLPFKALCDEKADHLDPLLARLSPPLRVKRLYGEYHTARPLDSDTGVVVCTIEKANDLVNSLLETDLLSSLCAVVVDELHMVGDEDRGYRLELLLTKLRYAGAVSAPAWEGPTQAGTAPAGQVQIIGMSATMPNMEAIARWLNAELYRAAFRPIPLQRFLVSGRSVKDPSGTVVRELPPAEQGDHAHLVHLVRETLDQGGSVLVFCATKRGCELTARLLADRIDVPELRRPGAGVQGAPDAPTTREEAAEALRRGGPASDGDSLAEAVGRGVAWHHSGLSADERAAVESAFRCGAVSVLAATSTLAAGVNLPARRVIFREPFHSRPRAENIYDPAKYRQMCGRAGRAGLDAFGEAYLLRAGMPEDKLLALMQASCEPVESCLTEGRRGMRQALLEAIASGKVSRAEDINTFISCTLLAATHPDPQELQAVVAKSAKSALMWLNGADPTAEKGKARLIHRPFIRWDSASLTWTPEPLGRACAAAGMRPEVALKVAESLETARENGVVMSTDLHLAFLCVPLGERLLSFPRPALMSLCASLRDDARRVAARVLPPGRAHLERLECLLTELRSGRREDLNPRPGEEGDAVLAAAQRLLVALLLHDVLQETPLQRLEERYRVRKADIERLQENASRFAYMSAAFCECMGWPDMASLLQLFTKRVLSGAKADAAALTEIPGVKAFRARMLIRAGLRTPLAVASVEDPSVLADVFAADARDSGAPQRPYSFHLGMARKIIKAAKVPLCPRSFACAPPLLSPALLALLPSIGYALLLSPAP